MCQFQVGLKFSAKNLRQTAKKTVKHKLAIFGQPFQKLSHIPLIFYNSVQHCIIMIVITFGSAWLEKICLSVEPGGSLAGNKVLVGTHSPEGQVPLRLKKKNTCSVIQLVFISDWGMVCQTSGPSGREWYGHFLGFGLFGLMFSLWPQLEIPWALLAIFNQLISNTLPSVTFCTMCERFEKN